MEDAEKKMLSARWYGEALREIAVLVVVFVPLDWFMGRQDRKIPAASVALISALVLFSVGVKFGYRGERGQENEGELDGE